jgi:hypothetical protein
MHLNHLVSKFGSKAIFNSIYSRILKNKSTQEVQDISVRFSIFVDQVRNHYPSHLRSSIIFKDGDFLFCRGDCEPLDLFIGNNDWTNLNSADVGDDSPISNDISLFSDLLWQIFIKV